MAQECADVAALDASVGWLRLLGEAVALPACDRRADREASRRPLAKESDAWCHERPRRQPVAGQAPESSFDAVRRLSARRRRAAPEERHMSRAIALVILLLFVCTSTP